MSIGLSRKKNKHKYYRNSGYYNLRGRIALAEARYDDAIKDFNKYGQSDKRNMLGLAEAYEANGNLDEAKRLYQILLNDKNFYFKPAFRRIEAKSKLETL